MGAKKVDRKIERKKKVEIAKREIVKALEALGHSATFKKAAISMLLHVNGINTGLSVVFRAPGWNALADTGTLEVKIDSVRNRVNFHTELRARTWKESAKRKNGFEFDKIAKHVDEWLRVHKRITADRERRDDARGQWRAARDRVYRSLGVELPAEFEADPYPFQIEYDETGLTLSFDGNEKQIADAIRAAKLIEAGK